MNFQATNWIRLRFVLGLAPWWVGFFRADDQDHVKKTAESYRQEISRLWTTGGWPAWYGVLHEQSALTCNGQHLEQPSCFNFKHTHLCSTRCIPWKHRKVLRGHAVSFRSIWHISKTTNVTSRSDVWLSTCALSKIDRRDARKKQMTSRESDRSSFWMIKRMTRRSGKLRKLYEWSPGQTESW